jgi:hypothetical protein
MYFSRIMFGGASLSVLSMFLALQTSSADVKPKYAHLSLACTTTLNVDPNQGVDMVDAYICSGTPVKWEANGHTFHVFFKKGLCPFRNSCKGITEKNPSRVVKNIAGFTVFEYGIVVDDDVFDPHVVGGGGNLAYSPDASKEEPKKD